MTNKFIVTPKKKKNKTDESVIMSIRIERVVQEQYTALAKRSKRSRNELISLALKYALENLEFIESVEEE